MIEQPSFKTMRLRYDGTCAGCGSAQPAGIRAHYLPAAKSVRCLACGPTNEHATTKAIPTATPHATPYAPADAEAAARTNEPPATDDAELIQQGPLARHSACGDCGRRLARGVDAFRTAQMDEVLCLDCVTLDTVHTLGLPGGGARREFARRQERRQARIQMAHPRLGKLILAVTDDPQHVRAWQSGAAGEEAFGQRLSAAAGPALKVLHDRKLARSRANIDHLAVTSQVIWVIDAKRYKGKVEARSLGLFSSRRRELFVGGRNKMTLVDGVRRQVEAVRDIMTRSVPELGIAEPPPVQGALVFVDAEFGLFSSPFEISDVWVGWSRALTKRLAEQTDGPLPSAALAKRLARSLRPG